MEITPEQRKRVREASHWFSMQGIELSPIESEQWDRWIADPRNRAEYDEFIQMVQMIRRLPRPPLPSAAELARDSRTQKEMMSLAEHEGEDW